MSSARGAGSAPPLRALAHFLALMVRGCRHAKSDPVLRKVPVLLMTALTDPADVLRAVAAGADNYCTKPYDAEILLERLVSALARRGRPDTDTTIELGGERFGRQPARLKRALP